MTYAEYYDIEGRLLDSLKRSLESRGIPAIEAQRGDAREGRRAELLLNLAGATEAESINPQNRLPFYSEYTGTLTIALRGPMGDYENHRLTVGRLRAMFEHSLGGRKLCQEHQNTILVASLVPKESLNFLDGGEEMQNEIATELNWAIRLRLDPCAMPAS